jgi:hypothetical protein
MPSRGAAPLIRRSLVNENETSTDDEKPTPSPASRKPDRKAMIVVACFLVGLVLLVALNMK